MGYDSPRKRTPIMTNVKPITATAKRNELIRRRHCCVEGSFGAGRGTVHIEGRRCSACSSACAAAAVFVRSSRRGRRCTVFEVAAGQPVR